MRSGLQRVVHVARHRGHLSNAGGEGAVRSAFHPQGGWRGKHEKGRKLRVCVCVNIKERQRSGQSGIKGERVSDALGGGTLALERQGL